MKRDIRAFLDRDITAAKAPRRVIRLGDVVKAKIRIKLYEKGSLVASQERPVAISKKCQVASEEIVRLDEEAKAERKRQQQRLDNARPTGERCKQKACPYRSVLDGNCRQHATDKILERSVLPSQLGAAAGFQ